MATSAPERPHFEYNGLRWIGDQPYYQPMADEIELFEAAHACGHAVMLRGPTGCGKTRFVEHMAWRLKRPVVTVACHDDLSASDLTGRYLIEKDQTVWRDGPLTAAVRAGAICYLDEVVEARQDTVVIIHPLSDDRRILPVDKTGEVLTAAEGFQLVVSYNPGYQHAMKDLKPSTRQRFVTLDFDLPGPDLEAAIVAHESGVPHDVARALVQLAGRIRNLKDRGLAEIPSTRLLVKTGQLIQAGIDERRACIAALTGPLTDEPHLRAAMEDLVNTTLV